MLPVIHWIAGGWHENDTCGDGDWSGGSRCCAGSASKALFSSDMMIACGLNGGASGGPWLVQVGNNNLGYVSAVTSRRSWDAQYLYAAPFGEGILSSVPYADSN